jgi:hypothetical protein
MSHPCEMRFVGVKGSFVLVCALALTWIAGGEGCGSSADGRQASGGSSTDTGAAGGVVSASDGGSQGPAGSGGSQDLAGSGGSGGSLASGGSQDGASADGADGVDGADGIDGAGDSGRSAGGGVDGGGTAGTDGAEAGSDPEFDTCYAALEANCVVSDKDTAEKINTAKCKNTTMIPIPLTTGGQYGPMTIKGGPYGAKIDWNQGANTEFVNAVNLSELVCVPVGISTFGQPATVNAELENLRSVDWSLYTIFRPACFKKGEKYPVITWANGTCGEVHGYTGLLGTLASNGFVIVASNSTWTATSPTDKVQLHALDYAKALNEDPSSVLYHKLDLDNVGAMGHSQGAMATGNADDDPRIKAVIFWNTGTSSVKPFLDISGDQDVGTPTLASIKSATESATQPGAWVYYHKILATGGQNTGHLVLMEQPDRVVDLAVAWWKWQLEGDAEAKKMFVGAGCGLCNHLDDYEYGTNGLLK